jgi:hypothetical protein
MLTPALRKALAILLGLLPALTLFAAVVDVLSGAGPGDFRGILTLAFLIGAIASFLLGIGATGLSANLSPTGLNAIELAPDYVGERVCRSPWGPFLTLLSGVGFLGLMALVSVSDVGIYVVALIIAALSLVLLMDSAIPRLKSRGLP